ncbi:MAG TPA: VWA domain-containing protein [Nitrospira sp.]|nr:VWA domain-containing protein [Nitrospira sp.]
MTGAQAQQQLLGRLTTELGPVAAEQLARRLTEESIGPAAVLTLLEELESVSSKGARAAIDALPELDRRTALSSVLAWLDLGVALSESSGATALRYFRDSPLVLGVIESPASRAGVLAIGLELADQDANVAFEYLRTAPQLVSALPGGQLRGWLEIGTELTAVDVVVGLEYIRQIPALVPVLPLDEVRRWLSFGMMLITPNSLGKPDYVATIEFLRTSPAILGDIDPSSLRSKVVALGALLAGRAPRAGIEWLAESPRLLRSLPSPELRLKVLQYGLLVAEQDAESALAYLRRAPDVIGLIGDIPDAGSRFEDWFKSGMEVLAYNAEGARAYFATETHKALASVEQALSGVPLRRVARRMKLFVQGLCGTDVAIAALPDSAVSAAARATVSADGRTILLPAVLRRYPTADRNERLYLVMAAHEAGHLEFGTYRLQLESLDDLCRTVVERYGRSAEPPPSSLAELFRRYPHPGLIRDLWTLLEDGRVERLLREEYPGLRQDLARLAEEAVTPRDPAQGLTAKELIVDCLLRLTTGESADAAVPHGVREEVAALWELCRPMLAGTSTAEDAVRCAHEVYVRMEELLAPRAGMIAGDRREEEQDVGMGPASSEQSGDLYRPVTNWAYRGEMNPEFVTRGDDETVESHDDHGRSAHPGAPSMARPSEGGQAQQDDRQSAEDALGGGRSLPSVAEELLALDVDARPAAEARTDGTRAVYYPEWDSVIQDYRVNWCRVIERPAEAGSDECVASVLTAHRSAVASLRRAFESLRPPALRRVSGQVDGEDIDLDAVVRRSADLLAGAEGGDRVYLRREKRERDVAAAFLVDVSGSTGKQLDGTRRVIDVEKESLVLLCEAMDALGDRYALYAYSGQGRASVEFLTIKDFDEGLGSATAHRVGGLRPRQQNRDGAAIRHASAKLLAHDAKTRLLLLLSDGRPLDGEYKDDYALEDTKAALLEAKRRGIVPFCVTIDRESDAYLRRMYGDVGYAVIDRVETLPLKLPRIYRHLAI